MLTPRGSPGASGPLGLGGCLGLAPCSALGGWELFVLRGMMLDGEQPAEPLYWQVL